MAPHRLVDKALKLCDLFWVWLNRLFHGRSQPRSGAALIAETSDPNARLLHELMACFVVITDNGWGPMKRVLRVGEPLLVEEEVAHVRDSLYLWLDRAISDALHGSVGIGDEKP